MDFEVNLCNAQSVTHFGCQNWEALCKMYGFYEGMIVTMDLGDPDIEQDNMDIWVLVDTLPILPLCEFLKHSYQLIYIVYFKIVDSLFPFTAYFYCSKNVREMVDKTHYTDGSELTTYKEKNPMVGFCTDIEEFDYG